MHLIITLPAVSKIDRSDFGRGDVRITYKAPFDYSENQFRVDEDQYRRRMEAAYGKDFARSMFDMQHKRDQQFRDWAMHMVAH